MPSTLKALRLLSDANRLRIFLLVGKEELSVAELQDILSMGQSTLSTHLAQMKGAGLVEDRRLGKNSFYRQKSGWDALAGALAGALDEVPEAISDAKALALALEKRKDRMRAYFDELAGKFGRQYVPGRSWKALAELLLQIMQPIVIADLGAGEGSLSQLLAQRATGVIAVDNSAKMVEYGSDLAKRHGVANLEYRHGDLEAVPIADASVDLALFSQSLHHAPHPPQAIREAYRILKPGGTVAVLDLLKHNLHEARELYADLWLGFAEGELRTFLADAGFSGLRSFVVHKDQAPPHFETLLVLGRR